MVWWVKYSHTKRVCSAGSTFLSRYCKKIGWNPFLLEIMMEIIIRNENTNFIPNTQRLVELMLIQPGIELQSFSGNFFLRHVHTSSGGKEMNSNRPAATFFLETALPLCHFIGRLTQLAPHWPHFPDQFLINQSIKDEKWFVRFQEDPTVQNR